MTLSIQQLITEVSKKLIQLEWKIVTAESCTGGGLAYWMTCLPGSSTWYERGFVTYSNEAKEQLLGVRSLTLETWGAVSEQTAREMAEGALKNSHAQISVAITGIAGPQGGTPTKPVGTVWIACANTEGKILTHVDVYTGDRNAIREQAIRGALAKLLEFI